MLAEKKLPIFTMQQTRQSLEDIFLMLTDAEQEGDKEL